MNKTIKIVLIVVAILALAGVATGLYLYNLKSADLSRKKPDFVLSASELQNAFETDEAGASAMYINKIIEVTGRISSVKPGENNALSISFETESAVSSVIATFTGIKDPGLFKTGEQMTCRGECSGFLMDVLLNNCAVISNK